MNRSLMLAAVLIALSVGGCAGSGSMLVDLEDPSSLAGTWHSVRWAANATPFTVVFEPTLSIDGIGVSGDYELVEGETGHQGLFVVLPDAQRILFTPRGPKPEPLTIVYLDAVKLVVGRSPDGSQDVVLARAE